MSIDESGVRRIAQLARIALEQHEVVPLLDELSRVLQLADQLAAADVTGIEPFAHQIEQHLREDAVNASDQADAFLALAIESRGGLYLVPKVLD